MFGLTTEKKLLDAQQEATRWRKSFVRLDLKWEELVTRINAKGGETFLQHAVIPGKTAPKFSDEDVRRLIQLCHPDKHGNSELSQRMTTMLTGMRK